ncbi:prolyl oligopeptidase family serine peptidase [Streptomyces sp. NPDC002680]|uniref:alpha/beta hydrolase family protein n=1 Tax=Streptomyces sp. NPDC002680 TaxID=3364659 RepID=UPI00369BFFC2
MDVRQFESVYRLGKPAPHPTSPIVVVERRVPDVASNRYVRQLWRVDIGDGSSEVLTEGRLPAFNHDGTRLAFLRLTPEGHGVLTVRDMETGTETECDTESDVLDFAWEPEGTRIAFSARHWHDRPHATGEAAHPRNGTAPRVTTRLFFDLDEHGYFEDVSSTVRLVDVDGGAAVVELTSGDRDDREVCWSPDGSAVAFTGSAFPHCGEAVRDVFVHQLATGESTPVSGHGFRAYGPVFSEDSRHVVFIGTPMAPNGLAWAAMCAGVYRAPVDGDAGVSAVAEAGLAELMIQVMPQPSEVICAGDKVWYTAAHRGLAAAFSVPSDGGLPVVESGSRYHVHHLAHAADGRVVAVAGDWQSPGELGVLTDGEFQSVTRFSADLDLGKLPAPQTVTAVASDGYDVLGKLFLPAGEGPHPLIVRIHGGPYWFESDEVRDDRLAYTQAGYAYLTCDFRATMGYGMEHAVAGLVPVPAGQHYPMVDDILSLLEGVCAREEIAADRVGVTGGSFGGLLTAWFVTHVDRFVSAIVESPAIDIEALMGTSDLGWMGHPGVTGPAAEMDVEVVDGDIKGTVMDVDLAPLAEQVVTPTMVAQYEGDLRTPVDQGKVFYRALRAYGKESAFVLFPGGHHSIEDRGDPQLRKHRIDYFLAWWSRHLPTTDNPRTPGNVFDLRLAQGTIGDAGKETR